MGCAGVAGTAGVAGIIEGEVDPVVVARIAGIVPEAVMEGFCSPGGITGGVPVLSSLSNPGAVKSPGGILPDSPAPWAISSLSFESVLGPTMPIDSVPYFS